MGRYDALFDDYVPPSVRQDTAGPLSQEQQAKDYALSRDPLAEGDADVSDPRWQRLTGNTPADVAERDQHDQAREFVKFAGLGAAGEIATPLVTRGAGSVADRARAIQSARLAARPTPVVRDPAALAPVEMGPSLRTSEFWVPRDGDLGPDLFKSPETSSSLAPTQILKPAPPMSVVPPKMEDPSETLLGYHGGH